jgi:hypothetical protein
MVTKKTSCLPFSELTMPSVIHAKAGNIDFLFFPTVIENDLGELIQIVKVRFDDRNNDL